jgi:hypothetical protein
MEELSDSRAFLRYELLKNGSVWKAPAYGQQNQGPEKGKGPEKRTGAAAMVASRLFRSGQCPHPINR